MSEVYLFQLATQRTQWLHARQSLIAGNVANANTPGYSARDLVPFTAVLDSTTPALSRVVALPEIAQVTALAFTGAPLERWGFFGLGSLFAGLLLVGWRRRHRA